MTVDGGLSPDEIIMEFAMMEISVSQRAESRVEKLKTNFSSGK